MRKKWIAIRLGLTAVLLVLAIPLRAELPAVEGPSGKQESESQLRAAAIAEVMRVGKISTETIDEQPNSVVIVQLKGELVNDEPSPKALEASFA